MLISYFFLHVLFLFHASNLRTGLEYLEKILPFIGLPIAAMFSQGSIRSSQKQKALIFFVAGALFTAITCMAYALLVNFQQNNLSQLLPNLFTYHDLLSLYGLHATYFGMYLNFAIIILIYLYTQKIVKGFLVFTLSAFFLVIIGLLQVRITFISTIISLAGALFLLLTSKFQIQKYKIGIIVLVICTGLFLVNFYGNSSSRHRILEIFEFNENDLMGSNSENGVTQRVFLWGRAIEAIQRKPIFGYGTAGDHFAIENSISKYLENHAGLSESQITGIKSLITEKFNAHNQFFTEVLMFGLFAGSSILLIFLGNIWMALRTNDILRLGFTGILLVCCLTEVVLARQKGIVFFALFYTFLPDMVTKSTD